MQAARRIDGRTRRRETNREAVLQATIALLTSGVRHPTAQQVADTAFVSLRSVFRYFSTVDALVDAAILHWVQVRMPELSRPAPLTGDAHERVAAHVAERMTLYEQGAPMIDAALRAGETSEVIREIVESARRNSRDRIRRVFARELEAIPEERRPLVVAAAHSSVVYERWKLLTGTHDMASAEVARVLRDGLRSALELPSA